MEDNIDNGDQKDATLKFNWSDIRQDLLSLRAYLGEYIKNPIFSIRHIPSWHWGTLLLATGVFAAICGLLRGAVSGEIHQMIFGFFLVPLSATVTIFICSGFFYYTFLFFMRRELAFKEIYTLIFLSSLPLLSLVILTPMVRPLSLLGLAISVLLMTVGFVEHFGLDKKKIVRLLGVLFFIYCILWIFNTINFDSGTKSIHEKATIESLDILEKELSD